MRFRIRLLWMAQKECPTCVFSIMWLIFFESSRGLSMRGNFHSTLFVPDPVLRIFEEVKSWKTRRTRAHLQNCPWS